MSIQSAFEKAGIISQDEDAGGGMAQRMQATLVTFGKKMAAAARSIGTVIAKA